MLGIFGIKNCQGEFAGLSILGYKHSVKIAIAVNVSIGDGKGLATIWAET